MKPVAFDLERVTTVDAAVQALSDTAREVKVLAGGQSLVPLLNFRLARPDLLIDVNPVAELAFIRSDAGGVHIGALTRQRSLERSDVVARDLPLVAEALPLVAHAPIRNRGTLGGSIAHADASAELCVVALALDGSVTARSLRGQREIPLAEFFIGPYMTALEPDELLTEVSLPTRRWGGFAFEELARRSGDFALAGVAALLDVDGSGFVRDARLAYASMGPTPLRARGAESALVGQRAGDQAWAEAAEAAVRELEPGDDIHADRAYRMHLAKVLTRRVLARAHARATGGESPAR